MTFTSREDPWIRGRRAVPFRHEHRDIDGATGVVRAPLLGEPQRRRRGAGAGYASGRANRTGYELLQKPLVLALVKELDAEERAETGIDEPWIVDRLVQIVEASMTGVPRTSALGEFLPDPVTGLPIVDCDWTNANRALASLAKITGLNVSPTPAFGDVVYKLTLDRDLS